MFDLGGWEMAIGSGFVGSASAWGLSASTRLTATRRGRICFLTYGWLVRCLAVALVPLALAIVYTMAHAPAKQIALAFVFTAAFLAFTIFVNYQVFFTRFGYDRNNLYFSSPFCEDKSVPWDNLEYAGRSPVAGAEYIEVTGIGRIWCPAVLNGHEEFTRFLEQKAAALLES